MKRGLGMTKQQCRFSIISDILILAVPAVIFGSGLSWVVRDSEIDLMESIIGKGYANGIMISDAVESDNEMKSFKRDYSLWVQNEHSISDIELDASAITSQCVFYFVIPLSVLFIIVFLSVVSINKI